MSDSLQELESYFSPREANLSLDEKNLCAFAYDCRLLLLWDYERPKDGDGLRVQYELVKKELEILLLELETDSPEAKEEAFLASLPRIRRSLNTSLEAILEGDPASVSKQQIALEYPGFQAILSYRIAHELKKLGLPIAARYLSEKAHSQTGIDINPGAEIGDYFFIDHGTGIVIGETTVIGNHVKLYQGVTLGALSLSKGRELVGKKRHPTVEDYVTIYSSAAIFGGDTVIGEGSTIGAVVYLTHSVPPHSLVLQTEHGIEIRKKP